MNVSLYIPCHNAQEYIAKVLDAALKQKLPAQEVIVVDDNSTDSSSAIISTFPVKLIRHKRNRGLAAARNTALKNAKFDFVASLDADCIPEVDWLEKLMKRFAFSETAGVGGKLLEKNTDSIFDAWRAVHMVQNWEDQTHSPDFLYGSNTVFRKSALEEVGFYDEQYVRNYEDVDICNRLKKQGYSITYEPKAVVFHLKQDSVCSLLNSFWSWNFQYYRNKSFYSSEQNFSKKLKDNIGLANRYIIEDISAERHSLLFIDFLLASHHSIKDFVYFALKNRDSSYPSLAAMLSLIDITFFFHFDANKNKLSSLMPETHRYLQNVLAVALVIGREVCDKFSSLKTKEIFYRYLFHSLWPNIENELLVKKILNLVQLQADWSPLYMKKHPYVNSEFLKHFSLLFQNWINSLAELHPEALKLIEKSALALIKEEENGL